MMTEQRLAAAVDRFEAGRYQDCIALCRAALKATPRHEDFLTLLAMGLQAEGLLEEAAGIFQKLVELRPEVAEYHANVGLMLRHLGRFDEAEAAFGQALSLPHPAHDTLINYGLLLLDMGRLADARHRFLDACELQNRPDSRIYATLACIECGDTTRAHALVPPPAMWPALDLQLRRDLTKALIQLGRVEEAERLLTPDAQQAQDPVAIARLGALHERTNRIESASELLGRIRQHIGGHDPDLAADALSLDAALALRGKDYARARQSTQAMLGLAMPPQARANAHFTMAKVADQQGLVDEAMEQLAQAHTIHFDMASDMVPDIAGSAEEPLRIASKWLQPGELDFSADPAPPSRAESPVFIVGFPRSGTTMLEQMLDSHPGYASMDERIIIQYCVEMMESKGFEYPHGLGQLSASDVADIRALYWSETRKVVEIAPGKTLVDKNPLNMLRVPMIRRLFPEARIILALRHPCDVILSCYMQNFRSPAFMVLCSTLERLSKSYVNAMRFWIHHQPLLCPDALLLRYEETVGDFPNQVERIADYLGIEDRGPLADFAAHAARKNYISTPSYSQVIEPVNTRAVARWEPYRRYFEPVFPILQPIADHWNYRLEN